MSNQNTNEQQPLLPHAHVKPKTLKSKAYWTETVSSPGSIPSLCLMSIVTGITSYVAFDQTGVWNGFLTGSTLQAFASLTKNGTFDIEDWQHFLSITCFGIGAIVGSMVTRRVGGATRAGLLVRSLLSGGTIIGAAGCLIAMQQTVQQWQSARGFVALALLSASTGLQALDGQSLKTEFQTTVVQTSVWLALFSVPPSTFFAPRYSPARDLRILSLVTLGLGATICQAIMKKDATLPSQAGALFCAGGIKLLVGLGWLFIQKEPSKEEMDAGNA